MANFQKNETIAAKRRCDLIVYLLDGVTYAPRGTSFAGLIYVSQSISQYVAAGGTLTNKRRPFTFADITISAFTANPTNTATAAAHGLQTGDGPVRLTTTGALPTGLATGTDYWIIKVDANTVAFAASLALAYAGTKVVFTTTGSGTNKITVTGAGSAVQRGLDGLFTYEATQAETNTDASEFTVIIEDGQVTYARSFTTVAMGIDTAMNSLAEGSNTYGDLLRLLAGVLGGKVADFRTGTLVFKSLDGTKTRLTVTTDASGRLTTTIGDLT